MKNLKALAVVVAIMMSSTLMAQTKIGYISVDNMVAIMPKTATLDSIIEQYQTDSIAPQFQQLMATYQWKDSTLRDTVGTPLNVRQQIEQELPTLRYQLQNWQAIVQQATEAKQNELLAPIYREVYEAIRAVAKEKGYTHVFNREALLVAPDGDDMIMAVAAKLKVTVPPQLRPGYKPPTGGQ